MKTIGRGISDYRKMVTNNNYLVDKTMLIKEFIENGDEVVLITRPRRFGKTLNMSMLSEFFDMTKDSKELFCHTKISKSEYIKYINTYPVIYISFKDCKGQIQSLVNELKNNILNLYFQHEHIFENISLIEKNRFQRILSSIDNDDPSITGSMQISLSYLSQKLYEYYQKKVIVLIDEYDTPFLEAKTNGYYDEIHDSLSTLLSSVLKDNIYLEKAMLTGIQRVVKENIFSDLNNITVCSVIDDKFSEYFGFTKEETEELLEYYDLQLNDDVRMMYDGYRIGNHDMYNPWSIINYASTKRLDKYWVNTGSNKMIRSSIKMIIDKEMFQHEYDQLMFNGELITTLDLTTSFQVDPSIESLWGLFVNAGYLTVRDIIRRPRVNVRYQLEIPNDEVKSEFQVLTADRMNIEAKKLDQMYTSLINEDIENFISIYQQLIKEETSYHDLKDENSYHMFMLGLLTYLKDIYKITSNKEAGEGRYDIRMESTEKEYPHIIIEMKNEKDKDLDISADNAIKQIINKDYDTGLKGKVIYIGLAHKEKKVTGKYKIKEG